MSKKFKNPTLVKFYCDNPNNEGFAAKFLNPEENPINEDELSRLFGVNKNHFSLNESCYGLSNYNVCILSSVPPTK